MWFKSGCLSLLLLLLGACSLTPKAGDAGHRAPVEDRKQTTAVSSAPTGANAPVVAQHITDNAGKPGYYTVKPGDTLSRIGLEHGQSWRELARWNQLDSPSRIEVGQVLRVLPPPVVVLPAQTPLTGAVTAPVAGSGAATGVPLPALGGSPATTGTVATGASPAKPTTPTAGGATTNPAANTPSSSDELAWAWPAKGSVLTGFDEVKNKGLDVSGQEGEAVNAAADGLVVYVGTLRGYGNLIVLKHNATYLSAYGHNKTIVVKEDQTVTKGQKIAEMGQSESDRVKLHFEIRRLGKPVDPALYLPKR